MRSFKLVLPLCALSLFVFGGCDKPTTGTPTKPTANNKAADDHDHDHADHDHAAHEQPVHGPNDGHMFKLTPSDLTAEWTHSSSNNIIKVFVLNKEGKANQAVKCEKVVITPLSGNNTTPFELPAVEPKDGAAAEFMLDSKDLNVAMTLGVKVEVKDGDKTYTGQIAPHAPHDH